MQPHVLRKQSTTTTHVVSRRTLVDESLIEAMMQTSLRVPGTGSTSVTTASHKSDDVVNNQRAAVEASREPSVWDDSLFPAIVSRGALNVNKNERDMDAYPY